MKRFFPSSVIALCSLHMYHQEVRSQPTQPKTSSPVKNSRILFLGTGSSIGTPNLIHLMTETPSDKKFEKNFEVCRKANIGDPRNNKNYRCNPSILIQHHVDTSESKNIIVDVGKTFRESTIRWFPHYKVKSVDAVILTHGHADAIFGLDDIRSVQPILSKASMPVYLTEECEQVVRRIFTYLFPKPPEPGDVPRFVSSITTNRIAHNSEFQVHSLNVLPFSVMHGEDLESMGFLFGNRDKVCYISDISRMLPGSLEIIKEKCPIDVLIVDALLMSFKHPTHFSLQQAIDLCKAVRPRRAFFVGMSSSMEHEEVNALLEKISREEGIDMQLAYDGLAIDVDL